MRDWIAKNEDEYIQKALSFCNKKYISDIIVAENLDGDAFR